MTSSSPSPRADSETTGPSAAGGWPIPVYIAVTAISAACGLIVEIVAGRIIAPYLGMSLYTWTAIIAVVLAGFSLGNWLGGRLADRPGDKAASAIAWSFAAAALTTLAVLPLLRLLAGPILSIETTDVARILLLTTALFFAPSVFVGIPSPVLTKLAIDTGEGRMGRLLGAFYAAGAVGSIIGTLAAGYIFISWLGSTATLFVTAIVYGILAALMALDATKRARRKFSARDVPLSVIGFIMATTALLVGGQALGAFRSNCDKETDYYCLRVDDASAQFDTPSRILVLDHLGHGINLRDFPAILVSPYVELQDRLVEHRFETPQDAFNAFFIGGGAFTLPRAWLSKYKHSKMTVAEIDPQVSKMARAELWLPESPRLKTINADARRALVANTVEEARYDVIIGDAFHDIAVPQHLVTAEFFEMVKASLKPDGMYLMNVVDDTTRPRLVLSVARTLKSVFDNVEVWLSDEPATRATFVLRAAAARGASTGFASRVQQGLAFRRMPDEWIARMSEKVSPIQLTDDFAPVDRLISAH